MKKVLKFSVIILCVLLAALIALAAADCFYYPRYRSNKKSVEAPFEQSGEEITVVSSNVRTWSPTDFGKKSWFYRADLLIESVNSVKPDIIGFQEVTPMHYRYLTDTLKGYDNVIAYRDNSPFHEACPVFYNINRFSLTDKGSFWLSETPDSMSKDWGAACYRICSYVILKDKNTQKQLVVFNTHLDHVSDEARINGINVVLDKIKKFGELPSIIMGDFNADESSSTYKSATENFLDAKYQTENTMSGATFQNWGEELDHENIDYFMISKTGFEVEEYKIITSAPDGVYPSDHFPISLKFKLQ